MILFYLAFLPRITRYQTAFFEFLTLIINDYRGSGYPQKFGDSLNDKGIYKRCEKANGNGNCEKNGAILYPKCKSGYYAFGCCICIPNSFKCSGYGFKNSLQLDISCGKTILIGDPKAMDCASGLQKQAGLCYKRCKDGYNGIGPVCWNKVPSGQVDCGMDAQTTSLVCSSIIFGQVISVVMLAINIATFGASGQVEAAAKQAELGEGFVNTLKSKFNDSKALYEKSEEFVNFLKKAANVANTALVAKDVINVIKMDNANPTDIIRTTAQIASLIDPTGIAGVTAAYSYTKCKALKF